ncbi:MAG TPA: Lrp/AsnC family transcriptional regulator [Candidatus Desulfovibrio intestinigallinarum]|nr:Lrp/AsnC family transcriptional regulator [Candidatus Desulfovibrio intestinigallinarum]
MTARIDETDRRILEFLHKNARATMKEIGEKVHLTGQAVKNRLERLEDLGILKSYTVNIDCPVFGYKTHALLRLQLKRGTIDDVRRLCAGVDCRILHCYRITGERAYVIDAVFADMEALHAFLPGLDALGSHEVHIVLDELRDPDA